MSLQQVVGAGCDHRWAFHPAWSILRVMNSLVLGIVVVAVVSAAAVAWFMTRGEGESKAEPPPRAWKSDTVTPVIQGLRNKAPERVARSYVVGQGALLALRMAEVDGEIVDAERDALKQFILERITNADEELTDRAVKSAEAGLENAIEVERAIEGLNAVSSEEQRQLLVDLLVHVAQADGVIHEEEIAFLKRIGGMLGIPDAAVEQRIAIDGGD